MPKTQNVQSYNKGWVGFDIDGTLAVYDGWKGPEHIGEPVPAMIDLIKSLLARGMTVKIFTARVCSCLSEQEIHIAKQAIEQWCLKHIGEKLEITSEKDVFMIEYYDDRAIQVEYNTGRLIQDGEFIRGGLI